MLRNEFLPYACVVIGRALLETRERLPAASRYEHPSVLVLEAHIRCDTPERLGLYRRARILGRQRAISECSLRCWSTRMAITIPTICLMPSTKSPSATQPANEKRMYLVRFLVR